LARLREQSDEFRNGRRCFIKSRNEAAKLFVAERPGLLCGHAALHACWTHIVRQRWPRSTQLFTDEHLDDTCAKPGYLPMPAEDAAALFQVNRGDI
jgi:hypothetical protein